MSDPNTPPPPPENNPYPERPPIFDKPDAPEYQEANQYNVPPPPPQGGIPVKDERNWAMFSHLSAIVLGILGSALGLPIFGFLGPLVIYLMKKDESAFIADQAKEALNFNITMCIVMFALILLSLPLITLIITVPLMFIVGISALVLIIMAAIKSSNGEYYRYPFTLRLVK